MPSEQDHELTRLGEKLGRFHAESLAKRFTYFMQTGQFTLDSNETPIHNGKSTLQEDRAALRIRPDFTQKREPAFQEAYLNKLARTLPQFLRNTWYDQDDKYTPLIEIAHELPSEKTIAQTQKLAAELGENTARVLIEWILPKVKRTLELEKTYPTDPAFINKTMEALVTLQKAYAKNISSLGFQNAFQSSLLAALEKENASRENLCQRIFRKAFDPELTTSDRGSDANVLPLSKDEITARHLQPASYFFEPPKLDPQISALPSLEGKGGVKLRFRYGAKDELDRLKQRTTN